jgi:HD superfamily phosphohydrolase
VRSLSPGNERTNDEIHSDIHFGPVAKCLIDTPHFQRLRGLKQLGTSEFTYINANHNRFEHSLGVMHLARLLVTNLREKQPRLGIRDKDVLCVTLAGLLHDIGHGCYSHVYDSVFPTQLQLYLQKHPHLQALYQGLPPKPANWSHEDGSLMMIDAMLAFHGLQIDTHNLDQPLRQIGDGIEATSIRTYSSMEEQGGDILTSRDWIFIKEAIQGGPLDELSSSCSIEQEHSSGFVGRPHCHQEFLYDIVNNRHSGLDVDKMDYYARDERRTDKGNGEVDHRLMDEAVVAWGYCPKPHKCFRCTSIATATTTTTTTTTRQHLMIAWPEKCVGQLADFFHRRFRNHSNIYQHKTTQASTYLISDILVRADPFYRIRVLIDDEEQQQGKPPMGLPISRAMVSPEHYLRLRDCIIDQIEATDDSNLREARLLIRRLRSREFYKLAAVKKIHSDNLTHLEMFQLTETEIAQELAQRGYHVDPSGKNLTLDLEDFIVEKSSLHMGAKEKHPLTLLRFVPKAEQFKNNKDILNLPQAIQVDGRNHEVYLTKSSMQRSIQVFCRSPSKVDLLAHVFEQWCAECEDGVLKDVVNTEQAMTEENGMAQAALLSQVSQEPWRTPLKSPARKSALQEEQSPIPFSQCRHFGFASSGKKEQA